MFKFESRKYDDMQAEDLKEMYSLRKKIFKDQLDWLVECQDGMEFDEYDNENTSYLIGKIDGEIICSCRFIDMKLKNMCTGVFYKYFNEMVILDGSYIEVTRLFIDKDKIMNFRVAHSMKLNFYLNIYTFAKSSGFEGVYAVVSERLLRSLIRSGWKIEIQQQGISEKDEYIYLIIMPTNDKNITGLINSIENNKIPAVKK